MFPSLTTESFRNRTFESGTLVADGSEQDIFLNASPVNLFEPKVVMINVDLMQGGDTIDVRVYYQLTTGGALEQITFQQLTGADGGLADGNTAIAIELFSTRFGIQITLEQTAGVNRNYEWFFAALN